jgi:hypothetical protein
MEKLISFTPWKNIVNCTNRNRKLC